MSSQLKRVAILYGGWSGERAVSLVSGREVHEAFQKMGYPCCLIDVTRDMNALMAALQAFEPEVVFMNALHGKGVEDGCLQGFLEVLGYSYTNSGVLSSAVAMDKDLSRKIFQASGIPTAPGGAYAIAAIDPENPPIAYPCVIKPIDEGSSLGVSILRTPQDTVKALAEWTYGDRAIIEKYIPGQELSVALLGDRPLGVLELEAKSGFYDYAAKYTDGLTAHHMPARIPEEIYKKAMELSVQAAKSLKCEGVSRVDWRYDAQDSSDLGGLYILEVNTQPGMTPLSIVPEIAAYAKISFAELLEWMINNPICTKKQKPIAHPQDDLRSEMIA